MAVPECSITAQLRHVRPRSMAMLPLLLPGMGEDPNTDGTVLLLCMES